VWPGASHPGHQAAREEGRHISQDEIRLRETQKPKGLSLSLVFWYLPANRCYFFLPRSLWMQKK
jgi:hypothetical protein